MSHPGGASLDGEPPASVWPRPSRDPPKGCPKARLEPRLRPFTCGVQRSPGGATIDGSSAPDLLPVVFSTAGQAHDPTSDVLHVPERIRHRCQIPVAPDRRLGGAAVSSKTPTFATPGRLPSPSAPSPGRTVRLRGRAWDHEEPATGVAARVLAAFAAATRLPAPVRHLSSPAGAGSQGARPMTLRSGPSAARRLLQPTRSTSTTARSSDPRLACEPEASVRSRAPLAPFSGVGSGARELALSRTVTAEGPCRAWPKPHPTPSLHRARAALPSHRRPRPKPRTAARAATGRGSRARGRMTPKRTRRVPSLGLRRRWCPLSRSPLRAPGSGRYPNPIRSDTPRRETAGPPAGDSGGSHPRLGMPRRRRHAPVRERCLHDPTSRAPAPAKGRSSRAHDDPLARGRRQCPPRPSRDVHGRPLRAMCRLRGHTGSRGPRLPPFREEERGSLSPRCLPSVSRPPLPRLDRSLA
jgi:hypothetical protein